jgi:hypothetical protein
MPNGSGIDTQWLSPARTWQHVAMAQEEMDVEEVRRTHKYLADIVCAANVVAKKPTRTAANRVLVGNAQQAAIASIANRYFPNWIDSFTNPRTLFRS